MNGKLIELAFEVVIALLILSAVIPLIAPEIHQAIHALAVISPCANCREAMLR